MRGEAAWSIEENVGDDAVYDEQSQEGQIYRQFSQRSRVEESDKGMESVTVVKRESPKSSYLTGKEMER